MKRLSSILSALFIFLAGAYLLKLSFDAAANLKFAERDFASSDFISTCIDSDLDTVVNSPGSVAIKNGHHSPPHLIPH